MTIDLQVNDSEPEPRRRPEQDSVERALAVVGDVWTFRILREAFFRVRRFDGFRKATGAAPNILTDRLKRLVEHGVFEKRRYSGHANRYEYRLTEKGRDLYPMIVMLMRWGDKWLADESGPPLTLRHTVCGSDLTPFVACSACGGPIDAATVEWRASDEAAPEVDAAETPPETKPAPR